MAEEVKKRKRLTKTGKIILDIVLLISLGVACYSGYRLYDGLHSAKVAKDTYSSITIDAIEPIDETNPTKRRQINWDHLRKINTNIAAWVYLEDSDIDYPVVYTNNNEYYLRHLINGEFSYAGTIFIDMDNNRGFVDKETAMYGHHMLDDPFMFADIEKYKDQSYYDTHKVIWLDTPNAIYDVYPIAGMFSTGTGDYVRTTFESDEEFMEYVDGFIANSTFVSDETVGPNDKIVLFSTCEYRVHTVDGRYAMIGKLVKVDE